MTVKYEILTQAYVDSMTDYTLDNDGAAGAALAHMTGMLSVPVSDVAAYAADLRQKERSLGHVYLNEGLAELLDIEAEGQYDGELAGAWATILRHRTKKETPYYTNGEPYYWIIDNGKRVTVYTYVIDALWNLGVSAETFYIRELHG